MLGHSGKGWRDGQGVTVLSGCRLLGGAGETPLLAGWGASQASGGAGCRALKHTSNAPHVRRPASFVAGRPGPNAHPLASVQRGPACACVPLCTTTRARVRTVCSQDVMHVHPLGIATTPPSMLYMVCDGHSGSEASTYVAANFLRILNSKLPTKMPSVASPKGALDSSHAPNLCQPQSVHTCCVFVC